MEAITSTRNARVAAAAALARRRTRRDTGCHLVEGPNAVAEALEAGVVDEVYAIAEMAATLVVPDDVQVTVVADHVLQRLADASTPQGIVAVARSRTAALDEVVGDGLLVVLHAVADPGNAGAIVRTADAAGAAAVVLTAGAVDVFGPKAVRAAAGSTYHLPLVVDVALPDVVTACRAVGQPVFGLDPGGAMSLFDLERVHPPLALVFGSEAHGLPIGCHDLMDRLVAIPRYGRVESLNVAAAAAVALYAAARAVHGEPPPITS